MKRAKIKRKKAYHKRVNTRLKATIATAKKKKKV
jgi:hypothetical protein